MLELDYRAIGKRIRLARINAGMTQEQLSNIIGLSPSHMSNIETGTTRVSLTTLVSLANALSMSADGLLCDNVIYARPQFEQDIQQMLDGCNEFEIRMVKNVTQAMLVSLRANEKLRKSD